jgi:hypothetical protein
MSIFSNKSLDFCTAIPADAAALTPGCSWRAGTALNAYHPARPSEGYGAETWKRGRKPGLIAA